MCVGVVFVPVPEHFCIIRRIERMDAAMQEFGNHNHIRPTAKELEDDVIRPGNNLYQTFARDRRASQIVLDILSHSMPRIVQTHPEMFERANSVVKMAIVWGRLHSYIARGCEELVPTPIDIKSFDMFAELQDDAYSRQLMLSATCRKRLQAKGEQTRLIWTHAEERFHIMRGIEWFLDGFATVYDALDNKKKLVQASLKHLYPTGWTFQTSFTISINTSTVKHHCITCMEVIQDWRSARVEHVCDQLLTVWNFCNQERGSAAAAAASTLGKRKEPLTGNSRQVDAMPALSQHTTGNIPSQNKAPRLTTTAQFEYGVTSNACGDDDDDYDYEPDADDCAAAHEKSKDAKPEYDENDIELRLRDKRLFETEYKKLYDIVVNDGLVTLKQKRTELQRAQRTAAEAQTALRQKAIRIVKEQNGVVDSTFQTRVDEVKAAFGREPGDVAKDRSLTTNATEEATKNVNNIQRQINAFQAQLQTVNRNRDYYERVENNTLTDMSDADFTDYENDEDNKNSDNKSKSPKRALLDAAGKLLDIFNGEFEEAVRAHVMDVQKGALTAERAKEEIVNGIKTADTLYNLIFSSSTPTTTVLGGERRNLFTSSPSLTLSQQYADYENELERMFDHLQLQRTLDTPDSRNELNRVRKMTLDFKVTDDQFVAEVMRQNHALAKKRTTQNFDQIQRIMVDRLKLEYPTQVPVYFCMARTIGDMKYQNDPSSGRQNGEIDHIITSADELCVNTISTLLNSITLDDYKRRVSDMIAQPVGNNKKHEPFPWFVRLGSDGKVNQAWCIETMSADVFAHASQTVQPKGSALQAVKSMQEKLTINGSESDEYQSSGLEFRSTVNSEVHSTPMQTPNISKMVFRFPTNPTSAEGTKAAIQTILQYCYASAINIGAHVAAVYVFDPRRIVSAEVLDEEFPNNTWAVLILMERMPFTLKKDYELERMRTRSANTTSGDGDAAQAARELNAYKKDEATFLSRLWVLTARMSAFGLVFLDAHGENIYGIKSKDGGVVPRLIDFDWQWGKVLHRNDIIPPGLSPEEQFDHPGWRPLYLLNTLFIGFFLRIDDGRLRCLPKWLSHYQPIQKLKEDAEDVAIMKRWFEDNMVVDRRTHIRMAIANEMEFMKLTLANDMHHANGPHRQWNEVHKVLGMYWNGGFFGGIDGIVTLTQDEDKVHDFAAVFAKDQKGGGGGSTAPQDIFRSIPGAEHPLTTPRRDPAQPGCIIGTLKWGAVVEVCSQFHNLARLVRDGLCNRQYFFNQALKIDVQGTEQLTSVVQRLPGASRTLVSVEQFHDVLQNKKHKNLNLTVLKYDADVLERSVRRLRRLYHVFKRHTDDYMFIQLLNEFVFTPHDMLPFPPGIHMNEIESCYVPDNLSQTPEDVIHIISTLMVF